MAAMKTRMFRMVTLDNDVQDIYQEFMLFEAWLIEKNKIKQEKLLASFRCWIDRCMDIFCAFNRPIKSNIGVWLSIRSLWKATTSLYVIKKQGEQQKEIEVTVLDLKLTKSGRSTNATRNSSDRLVRWLGTQHPSMEPRKIVRTVRQFQIALSSRKACSIGTIKMKRAKGQPSGVRESDKKLKLNSDYYWPSPIISRWNPQKGY